MSNYRDHALTEFRAAGWTDADGKFNDDMQEMICNHVLKLLDVFADEGHSGSSAPYAINLFKNLADFKPIVPLTGEDWEWVEHSDSWFQNKRCGGVFKCKDRFDGQPYYLDATVFWNWFKPDDGEPFKSYYTSSDSAQVVTFPYTPETKYVFVPTEQFPNENL